AGALWPNAAETFEICLRTPPGVAYDKNYFYADDSLKNYEQQVTRIVRETFDAPEAGSATSWAEYMDDQVTVGTSGEYGIESDNDMDPIIRFRSISVENAVIDENAHGVIDTVYFENNYTVRQLVDEYGLDK